MAEVQKPDCFCLLFLVLRLASEYNEDVRVTDSHLLRGQKSPFPLQILGGMEISKIILKVCSSCLSEILKQILHHEEGSLKDFKVPSIQTF